MDHIIPQAEFPEFAIHPKNLIPSCGTCNQHKGNRWRTGLDKNTINLYRDQLPSARYLRVEIFLDEFVQIDFRFQLRYQPGTNPDMFALILTHFSKLHLLSRMREAAISHFTEFQNSIRPKVNKGESRASLTASTLESCAADRAIFGHNHWKPVMLEGLVQSDLFWESL